MSDADRRQLEEEHPNLYQAVQSGRLPEPNSDFVAVAKQYPLPREE